MSYSLVNNCYVTFDEWVTAKCYQTLILLCHLLAMQVVGRKISSLAGKASKVGYAGQLAIIKAIFMSWVANFSSISVTNFGEKPFTRPTFSLLAIAPYHIGETVWFDVFSIRYMGSFFLLHFQQKSHLAWLHCLFNLHIDHLQNSNFCLGEYDKNDQIYMC